MKATTSKAKAPATNGTTAKFLTLVPPAGLLTKTTNPKTKKTNFLYPLQTAAWLKMQTVANTALSFPITKATFVEKYGTFTDEATVLAAVGVLKNINTIMQQYGDPQTFITSIPKFQKSKTAPKSIYGNAVWLAFQTELGAQNIVATLNTGLKDIGEINDPATRLEDLKELLVGQGGVSTQAQAIINGITAFSTKTTAFYTALNAALTGPTDSLQVYLNQKDNVLTEAENIVKSDLAEIAALNKSIDHLNKEYIGFVVAASLSPLFLLIPFIGEVLAVADAVTFAVLAEKVKKAIATARTEVGNEKAAEQLKANLVQVLKGFNLSVADVQTDGVAFLATIKTMLAGWTEFDLQIKNQLNQLTVNDVSNWSQFMQKVGFQNAISGWNLIETKAEDFATKGIISFSTQKSS